MQQESISGKDNLKRKISKARTFLLKENGSI